MTAAVEYADDPRFQTFLDAQAAYVAQNRHSEPVTTLGRNAQRAGLAAVQDLDRHPDAAGSHPNQLKPVADLAEMRDLVSAGWTCRGSSTFRTAITVYWLEPPSTDRSTEDASPVDSAVPGPRDGSTP